MAMCKYPRAEVVVPASLIRLVKEMPELHCNLRLGQRPTFSGDRLVAQMLAESLEGRNEWIHQPFGQALRALQLPSKVLLYLQGVTAEELGTALVEITSIYWTPDHYPRLDFVRPEGFEQISPGPYFWGGFVLAMLTFPRGFSRSDPLAVPDDASGREFARIAELITRPIIQPGAQS